MKKKFNQVYQFKITLENIKPPIWRRILVPQTYTFWDFHVAIQDAMGWYDCHLHEFEITNPLNSKKTIFGIPYEEEDFESYKTLSGWRYKISNYFSMENQSANYYYDFGDGWKHKIILEKILPKENDLTYPLCIKGKRACPPEDCGGLYGYEDFLKIIGDPEHKEYKETLEWVGGKFDPEDFNPKEVFFDDPAERLKDALSNM